ncbi:MAG: response regulator transcription factor [Rhizobiaceae bacterium]
MRIAIVEDNKPLADGIAKAFEMEGHGVDQLHTGDGAVEFLCEASPDLIVLDVNLPRKSGLDILRDIRANGVHSPVLLLTARSDINDKVTGLDLGADDYLTKPFDLIELKARARALLRRSEKKIGEVILVGELEFDPEARQVRTNGLDLNLPRREYALAEILIRSRDRIISKHQIIDHLYGAGAEIEEGTVELYIHRLRKRLAGSGTEIKTARGLGYCFREIA